MHKEEEQLRQAEHEAGLQGIVNILNNSDLSEIDSSNNEFASLIIPDIRLANNHEAGDSGSTPPT